jgi:NTE family protein
MKKLGLVLSGGGARGLAHIGVIKVLEENGIRPDYISGASMGAIVGGIYASGATVRQMENFVRDFVFGKVLDEKYPLYKMQKLEKMNAKLMKYFSVGLSLNYLVRKKALDSGRKVQYMLKQLTGDVCFDKLRIPFACTASDLLSGKLVVLNEGKVYMAIRASMSIPLVFEPVRIGDHLLVDGGVASNAPSFLVREMGAEVVVVIDVNPPVENKEEKDIKTPLDMAWRSYQITQEYLYRRELKEADYVVEAHVDAETLDFSKNMEYVKTGEDAMRKNIGKIKKLLEV